MALLQQRGGLEAGAKKFAECMHLLEQLFQLKHTFEIFHEYWNMFVFMKPKDEQMNLEIRQLPGVFALFTIL